ncbi:hypothetical protein POKO110462_04360 [Pontibacter korlensis]|uniref:Uncharacterized protein n=1 Tax=Pontibacter korlensis TaxID=400092 RepID=A0A0E3ZDH2_9BACT|nr:hypothetical protein [Pontibacter korlensis]AKD03225.1 hypothetical protein PKOR_08910 [Pontibacter korlensis]
MNFDDIQKSWQTQQAPATEGRVGGTVKESNILNDVKALQRKVIHTNTVATVVIGLTAAAFVFVLRPLLKPSTVWYDIGIGLTLSAAFSLGLIHWFKSMPWKKQVNLSSKAYVEQVLKSLRYLNAINKKLTPFLMVVILAGINLIYFDIFLNESAKLRLVMHILLNAFMLTAGIASLYYSERHNDQSYVPIIKELEELQQKLEEI